MITKLDLNIIDTHNFKTIGIADVSIYNNDIAVENVLIEITPPGFKNSVSPFFMAKGLNIYNSNNVGLTKSSCEEELIDLPDGLWKIKYSICPNDKLFIEKIYLKTDKIQCKFTQAFLTLDLENLDSDSEKYKRKILDNSEIFLEGAIAASNNKDYKLASNLYKKANKMLGDYLNGSCQIC